MWNLDGSTGGLGEVSLTNYGSYASSLNVGQVASPGYNRAKYAMPVAPGTRVALKVPGAVASGERFVAKATVRVPAGGRTATGATAALQLPDGWTAGAPTAVGGGGRAARRGGDVPMAGPGAVRRAAEGV